MWKILWNTLWCQPLYYKILITKSVWNIYVRKIVELVIWMLTTKNLEHQFYFTIPVICVNNTRWHIVCGPHIVYYITKKWDVIWWVIKTYSAQHRSSRIRCYPKFICKTIAYFFSYNRRKLLAHLIMPVYVSLLYLPQFVENNVST